MTEQSPAEAIFFSALEKTTPGERAAYLDAACGEDSGLRHRVERLLEAHPKAGDFLEPPAPRAGERTAAYVSGGEEAGMVIAGRYKLLEQIGEGGMGTVWVAEQTAPVRRKVALKLIKAGMDSKSVLARFEAERQALAVMDHPNIAKVLDGGLSETGRPFFVMEYVKGVPITEYCDAARLSVPVRLELFVQVCHAVQHAHQKGIIHRDLKPSNILVAPYDDKPVPKVIDFGLAKAMHQPLTERTLHTTHESVLGTPLYMSPEQAQLNNLDVDTRSDIYSLGVLLYELLTGTTPLEKKRFKEAAWEEVRRIIREEEPPPPSLRLSSAQALPSLAAGRAIEPARLTRLLRGELDWIVMKSLEKDRNRRYDTANGFAADIQRYLAGEPVQAHPTSKAYRLRKFVRKHQVVIATTSAFIGMLIAAIGVTGALAVIARRAERLAEEKRIEAEDNAALAKSSQALAADRSEKLAASLKDAERTAAKLQVDLDLANGDRSQGLLRLSKTLKGIPKDLRELREYVSFEILGQGQGYAPLLPPISHEGLEIRFSEISSTGERVLTRGADQTARLWDAATGSQIAILRNAQEKVIESRLSPDGATAFTHSLDGVVRLWETKDGAFRAETEPRPDRFKIVGYETVDEQEIPAPEVTRISNDRLITSSIVLERLSSNGYQSSAPGQVELWNSQTGRLVARLDIPVEAKDDSLDFFGDGRWITPSRRGVAPSIVFSSRDGTLMGNLKPDQGYGVDWGFAVHNPKIFVSPNGHTFAQCVTRDSKVFVQMWDSTSLKTQSITGPMVIRRFDAESNCPFAFITDDLFVCSQISAYNDYWWLEGDGHVYRSGQAQPIATIPNLPLRFEGDYLLLHEGLLVDRRTWKLLQPPQGRKYHPAIANFTRGGRFVDDLGIDIVTERSFLVGAKHLPKNGSVSFSDGPRPLLVRFPPLGDSDIPIPSDILELWLQVAVRGELDREGNFVEWDEAYWEKKRQELAAKPAPVPDFPFPGHVAEDRLHWLRQEYENAIEFNKPRLAKQLLDRAEADGDASEAVRWRAALAPKAKPAEPASPN